MWYVWAARISEALGLLLMIDINEGSLPRGRHCGYIALMRRYSRTGTARAIGDFLAVPSVWPGRCN